MQNGLFRKVALERLSSPEQLDQLMQATTPKGWLALLGLASLLVVALLWGILGKIETAEVGQGILVRGSGVQTVESPRAGQVTRILVHDGDTVKQGQAVASVQPIDSGDAITLTSPYAGRILEIRQNEGSIIQAGATLLSLELTDEDLQVVLYMSPTSGNNIKPGMNVRLSLATVRQEEYGVMLGTVTSVGQFPATYQGMLRVLGSDELARLLSQGGTPVEVRVELKKAGTDGGYQWSTSKGPAAPIQSGTFVTASIVIAEQSPISLLFGTVHG